MKALPVYLVYGPDYRYQLIGVFRTKKLALQAIKQGFLFEEKDKLTPGLPGEMLLVYQDRIIYRFYLEEHLVRTALETHRPAPEGWEEEQIKLRYAALGSGSKRGDLHEIKGDKHD